MQPLQNSLGRGLTIIEESSSSLKTSVSCDEDSSESPDNRASKRKTMMRGDGTASKMRKLAGVGRFGMYNQSKLGLPTNNIKDRFNKFARTKTIQITDFDASSARTKTVQFSDVDAPSGGSRFQLEGSSLGRSKLSH